MDNKINNILLLEDDLYSIKSLKRRVKEIFPSSSILKVNKSNYYNMLKLQHTTPLLTEGWAIFLSSRLSSVQCSKFFDKNEKNLVILQVSPAKKNDRVVELSELGISFKIVDNIKVSKDVLIEHASKELNISTKDATTLCNRCNNYLPYVSESIAVLKTLGRKVTRADILKYVEKRSSTRVLDIFFHIIKFKPSKESDLATMLYDFRYAFDYIKKNLIKYFDTTIYLYTLFESGYLGLDNYKDFEYNKKVEFSPYMVKKILDEVHPRVSLKALLVYKHKVYECKTMFELLDLL